MSPPIASVTPEEGRIVKEGRKEGRMVKRGRKEGRMVKEGTFWLHCSLVYNLVVAMRKGRNSRKEGRKARKEDSEGRGKRKEKPLYPLPLLVLLQKKEG
jgi:hypothetical protein